MLCRYGAIRVSSLTLVRVWVRVSGDRVRVMVNGVRVRVSEVHGVRVYAWG